MAFPIVLITLCKEAHYRLALQRGENDGVYVVEVRANVLRVMNYNMSLTVILFKNLNIRIY